MQYDLERLPGDLERLGESFAQLRAEIGKAVIGQEEVIEAVLATLLAGGERPAMSEGVRADMRRFLEAYESDPVDPKALKIKGVGAQQVVEVLKSVYLR